MKRPWMFLLIFICAVSFSGAQLVFARGYEDPEEGFQTLNPEVTSPEQTERVVEEPVPSVSPVARGDREPSGQLADDDLPTGGEAFDFSKASANDLASDVVREFRKLFRTCAPAGCTGGSYHICRSNCHNHTGSCHNSGEAMDISGLVCNGERKGVRTKEFRQLVTCGRAQRIDMDDRKDKTWYVAFEEDTADRNCAGVNVNTTGSKVTSCHWDHAHFSIRCLRKRSSGWRWSW